MKVKNCLVILAGSAIVLTSSGRSSAQTQNSGVVVAPLPVQIVVFPPTYYETQPVGYKTTWDNGIAASPRARQVMMENKYPMTAMGGSESIAGESTGGNVILGPQSQQVWLESHLGVVPSRTYNQPRGVGYEVTSDYGIAAPPRAWKTMCENPFNREMNSLR
jgi:hypothetical protein